MKSDNILKLFSVFLWIGAPDAVFEAQHDQIPTKSEQMRVLLAQGSYADRLLGVIRWGSTNAFRPRRNEGADISYPST